MKNNHYAPRQLEKEKAAMQAAQYGPGAAGLATSANCIEREREIPERIVTLRQVIEYLSERVAVVRDRTSAVSGPTPPMNKDEPVPSRTPLGGELAELASKVALIARGVEDILMALEL